MAPTVTTAGLRSGALPVTTLPNMPWSIAAGTSEVLTGTYVPVVGELTDGLILGLRATAANTSAEPTFGPDGHTPRWITKNGGQTLGAGDIHAAGLEMLLRYNAATDVWEWLNPALVGSNIVVGDFIYPEDMPGETDTEQLQAAIDLAEAERIPLILSRRDYVTTDVLRAEAEFNEDDIFNLHIIAYDARIVMEAGGTDTRAIISTTNYLDNVDALSGPIWIEGDLVLDGGSVAGDGLLLLSYAHRIHGRVVIVNCLRHGYSVPSFLSNGVPHANMGTIGQVVDEVMCEHNGDTGIFCDTSADWFLKGGASDNGIRNAYASLVACRMCLSTFWSADHSHPGATESAYFFGYDQAWLYGSQFGSDSHQIDSVVFEVSGASAIDGIRVQGGGCRASYADPLGFYDTFIIRNSYFEEQDGNRAQLILDTNDAAAKMFSEHNSFGNSVTGYLWEGSADGVLNAHQDYHYNLGIMADGPQDPATSPNT